MSELNGAQALLRTLVDCGVGLCFGNPGTSEMHFVAALDAFPEMRGVLCLFEGVATGAADGYGRMTDRPAATLLHLGPGLGNGIANLHNARRAGTPVLNIVGDHATYHKHLDAPLESDVDALAGTVSIWLHRSTTPADVGVDAAAAVAAALRSAAGDDGTDDSHRTGTSGAVATLILPADVSWEEGGKPADPLPHRPARVPSTGDLGSAARALEAARATVLLLGGRALGKAGLRAASRIEQATGVRVLAEADLHAGDLSLADGQSGGLSRDRSRSRSMRFAGVDPSWP